VSAGIEAQMQTLIANRMRTVLPLRSAPPATHTTHLRERRCVAEQRFRATPLRPPRVPRSQRDPHEQSAHGWLSRRLRDRFHEYGAKRCVALAEKARERR